MKKYRVSLAVNVPYNYEVEVEAATPADATRAAIEEFGDARDGSLVDIDDGDITLDLRDEFYEGQEMEKFGGVAVWEDVNGSMEEVY